jgi:TRAP-type C4-dicarboxylate transport system permease small subunit
MIHRLLGRMVAVVEWWAVCLMAGLAALVCFGIFFRYVLNSSLVWYDEFASYMLVWLTFYGCIVVDYQRRHIGFDLLVEKLKPAARRVVDVVAELAVLGFQFVLFYYGWILTERMGDETAISLPWIKVTWITSVLPVTGGLLLLISLARLFELLTGRTQKRGGHEAWSGSSSE